jgi:FkbM family methyltransferase
MPNTDWKSASLGAFLYYGKRLSSVSNHITRARTLIARQLREWRVRGSKEPVLSHVQGFWMWLDPQQYLDRQLLIEGIWEPPLTAFIRHSIRNGDTCIDVGAHKGYVTCLLASVVGAAGTVLSFEPDPRAFDALSKNLRMNQYQQVQPFSFALGAEDGSIPLTLTNTLGWSSRYPNPLARSDEIGTITVNCIQFDGQQHFTYLLSESRCLSFVKIDAEGCEPEIWYGMIETIKRFKPLISMEINYQSLKGGKIDVLEFKNYIHSAGYHDVFEPIVVCGGPTTPRCALKRIDISKERPLLVDTIMANRQSPYYGRITDLIRD